MRSHQAILPMAAVLTLLSATASAQNANVYAELPRFQQVNERLYRGGQPGTGGISRLRELGINTVINLRGASNRTRTEEAEVKSFGLNYFNIGLPNWGRPEDGRVSRILEIINASENGRVFIHCRSGVDRTGLIVAMYRMTQEGRTSTEALAEAEQNGMRRLQYWMRDYAEDYGRHIAKVGPESAFNSPDDFDDRIGSGMRIMERGTFRARKVAARFLRKFR